MLSAFCMSLLVSLLSHEVCSHIILTPISIGAKVMNGRFHVVEKLASSKVRSISQRHTRQLIQKEPDDVTLRSIQTFRQIQLLAAGGFGEVWKAFDTEKKKYVVIKTILYTKNETTQDIFNLKKERLQEIALTRKAQECPNVARMALEEQDDYKYYDEHGGNLLIMDYYAGSHLKQYSKGKTQHGVTGPWNRRLNMVTNLIPQIGVAVSCLHKIGIIHRDVSLLYYKNMVRIQSTKYLNLDTLVYFTINYNIQIFQLNVIALFIALLYSYLILYLIKNSLYITLIEYFTQQHRLNLM